MASISWAESYLGQLRALAGDRTLMFVGARCVVRDADDRVLLIQRSDNGLWALPAGAMELGESIAGCAARAQGRRGDPVCHAHRIGLHLHQHVR
jgi:hypothetical protein